MNQCFSRSLFIFSSWRQSRALVCAKDDFSSEVAGLSPFPVECPATGYVEIMPAPVSFPQWWLASRRPSQQLLPTALHPVQMSQSESPQPGVGRGETTDNLELILSTTCIPRSLQRGP